MTNSAKTGLCGRIKKMECVHCGEDAFNRIIVNPTTGAEHSGLCEECEQEKFGLLTSEPLWRQAAGCGLCPEEAEVALPEIETIIEWDDGAIDAEYTIDDTTLHLCLQHLTEILEIEESVAVSPIRTRA